MKGRYEGTDPHVAALLGMTGRQGIFPLFSVIVGRPAGLTRRSVLLLAVWLRGACSGGHIGPPLRGFRKCHADPGERAGTEPRPYMVAEVL